MPSLRQRNLVSKTRPASSPRLVRGGQIMRKTRPSFCKYPVRDYRKARFCALIPPPGNWARGSRHAPGSCFVVALGLVNVQNLTRHPQNTRSQLSEGQVLCVILKAGACVGPKPIEGPNRKHAPVQPGVRTENTSPVHVGEQMGREAEQIRQQARYFPPITVKCVIG